MPDSDSIFWKRKLAAFLHDPPSKALDIRTHTERSEKAMLAAGLGTPEERCDWEHTADHTAAAADRFPFPHHSKASLSCAFDGVRNVFHHPLNGGHKLPFDGPFITVEQAIEGEQTTQPVLNDLRALHTDEHDRARFLAHWRLWAPRSAEKDWRFAYLPADTRIPDHSIWNHMQIVSALDSCRSGGGGLQPAFLKFQLGPVQDFIQAARSTRDLWSGSYLLSWLMAHGLAKLSLAIGPDTVVFPSLREQPLIDLALKHQVWNRVKIGDRTVWESDTMHWSQTELLTPNLPNVFLAIVPADRAEELAKAAGDAIQEEWERISKSVWADCDKEGLWKLDDKLQPPGERRARFDHQIDHFLSLSWSVLPWPETLPEIEKLAKILPPSATNKNYQTTKAAAEAIRSLGHGDDRYFDSKGQLKNEGIAWCVLTSLSSWQLDAVRQTRAFHANLTDHHPSQQHSKDSLTGKEEAIAGGSAWKDRKGGLAERFKHDDYLSAPTLVKRLWDKTYLHKAWKDDLGHEPQKMPNTRSLAAHRPYENDADDDTTADAGERYFAVIAFDGDDMGKWISGEKTPPFATQLASYEGGGSLEYFQRPAHADKFTDFLKTPRPLSPSYHLQFSECLSNFALRCVRPIVEAHDGRLIYAGGDDVAALLPADTALACANDLQLAFTGHAPLNVNTGIQQKNPGFLTSDKFKGDRGDLIPFMVPGPAATASVGIAIAHFKSPLQDTVRAAQAAEKRAKKLPGKSAFAVSLFKRSGEITEWGGQWKNCGLELYQVIAGRLDSGDLGGKFPHRVCQLLEPYLTRRTGLSHQQDASDFNATAIIEREFSHAISRQSKQGVATANAAALTPLLQTYLNRLSELHGKARAEDKPMKESLNQLQLEALIGLCTAVAFTHRTRPEFTTAEKQTQP